jgi:transposase
LGNELTCQKFINKERGITSFLKRYPSLVATIESTYGWYWLADDLKESNIPYCIAHPAKVKAVAGRKKTDHEDALILANLLRTNLLPTAYCTSNEERVLRQRVRYRQYLVETISGIKTRLRDISVKRNTKCPFNDVLGKKALLWWSMQEWNQTDKEIIGSFIKLSQTYQNELQVIDQMFLDYKQDKTFGAELKRLDTIPGIGITTACIILGEIGSIKRFSSYQKLASYAGVVPSVHSSGGKTYLGKTGGGSRLLRYALAEAVKHLIKKEAHFNEVYQRLSKVRGKSIAKVALMHKLIQVIFVVLKDQRNYILKAQVNLSVSKTTTLPDGQLKATQLARHAS